jgi:hypothetical protein
LRSRATARSRCGVAGQEHGGDRARWLGAVGGALIPDCQYGVDAIGRGVVTQRLGDCAGARVGDDDRALARSYAEAPVKDGSDCGLKLDRRPIL